MPVPVMVVKPTDSVTVQVPAAGKPLKSTLPVAVTHVGCVTALTIGATGNELTAIVTGAEEVGLPVGQTSLEVRAIVITSPLTGT